MGVETGLLVAGLALTGLGTGFQFIQQRKQAKAEEKQVEAQQRAQELAARRERRRILREQRIARGQLENQAAQVGAQDSSAEFGGLSSLSSQAGFEIGFSKQTEGFGAEFTRQGIRASRAGSRAALGSGISSIGGSLFSFGRSIR